MIPKLRAVQYPLGITIPGSIDSIAQLYPSKQCHADEKISNN